MVNPDSPVKMPELHLIPEADKGIELDTGMKQVMAVLTAYYREERVTLRASQGGILYTASPQIKDTILVPANATPYVWQGDNIACSEVGIGGVITNTALVWVRPHKAVDATHGWLLGPGEVICISVNNLNQIHLKIELTGELACIAYTE